MDSKPNLMSKVSLAPSYVSLKNSKKVKSPGRKSLDCELYGLGKTMRHLQPPGGKESGIFDAFLKPDIGFPALKRKPNNYFKSYVFQGPKSSPPRPITPEKDRTFYKIFIGTPPRISYRSSNSIKSTVFDTTPKPTPTLKKYTKKNPITGESCGIKPKKLKPLTVRNPITFEGIVDRYIRSRYKLPPGGPSSIVLEYSEKIEKQ